MSLSQDSDQSVSHLKFPTIELSDQQWQIGMQNNKNAISRYSLFPQKDSGIRLYYDSKPFSCQGCQCRCMHTFLYAVGVCKLITSV